MDCQVKAQLRTRVGISTVEHARAELYVMFFFRRRNLGNPSKSRAQTLPQASHDRCAEPRAYIHKTSVNRRDVREAVMICDAYGVIVIELE